jgi:ABC-type phosphate transport system substrate-binding protein
MKLAFPVLLSSLLSSASTVTMVTATPEEVYSLHGSGTTNPSKCYWSIMERMQARSQQNIRVTYRAVGSTAGQDEFINNGTAVATDTFESTTLVDFASGDIPLTMARYNVASDANIDVIQLPVVLGAVTFFHSVEDANGEPIAKLNLTACVLADIFTGEITEWDHPDIKALNDNLDLPDGDDNTITVARRVKGSSSTDSITKVRRCTVLCCDVFVSAFGSVFWFRSGRRNVCVSSSGIDVYVCMHVCEFDAAFSLIIHIPHTVLAQSMSRFLARGTHGK